MKVDVVMRHFRIKKGGQILFKNKKWVLTMINRPYGQHWKGHKGFRVIEGNDVYNHRFGGQEWNVPKCRLCGEDLHQILCFDLKDDRLSELRTSKLEELPLTSCLNCSTLWEPQLFQLNPTTKSVTVLIQNDKEKWIQDEEGKITVPLPYAKFKLIDMLEEDIPVNEDAYYDAFDLFGQEYICRVLGAPLYVNKPNDISCPICNHDMQYVSSITHDFEVDLVSVVDLFLGEMIIYFYFCKECLTLKTEIQGT